MRILLTGTATPAWLGASDNETDGVWRWASDGEVFWTRCAFNRWIRLSNENSQGHVENCKSIEL